MSLVPEVKCPRCDRRYMALRTRCPYCGTSRRRKTGKSADSDNAMWKSVVGSALLLALAVAVVVLMVDAKNTRSALQEANMQAQKEEQEAGLEKTVTSLAQEADAFLAEQQANIQEETGETVDLEPTTPSVPEIPIESVKLYIGSNELGKSNSNNYDYDIRVPLGYSYTLSFSVVPESRNEGATATWSTEDNNIVSILQSGKITGMSTGVTYIHCKVDNAEAVVIVRVG